MSVKHSIKHFSTTVYGETWNVYKVSADDNVTIDESSRAEIDPDNYEITFKTINLRTVIHEVCHLYVVYTYTSSSDLSGAQVEELMCELFSVRGEEILAKAREIHTKLQELN